VRERIDMEIGKSRDTKRTQLKDLKAFVYPYKGQDVTTYRVREIATFTGVRAPTLNKWIKLSVIPEAQFFEWTATNLPAMQDGYETGEMNNKMRVRLYSTEEVLVLKYLLEKHGRGIESNDTFRAEIHHRFDGIRDRLSKNQSALDLIPFKLQFANMEEFLYLCSLVTEDKDEADHLGDLLLDEYETHFEPLTV